MEKAQEARSVYRSSFKKEADILTLSVSDRKSSAVEMKAAFSHLEQKFEEMCVLDREIFDLMLEQNVSEEDLQRKSDETDVYSKKYRLLKEEVLQFSEKRIEDEGSGKSVVSKFKLPQLELKKFGGQLRDWIHFWGLFSKIDENPDLDNIEKFNFLLQSTEPGSRARRVVESFPPSNENYIYAITALKSPFGREDLLIEMYIRELLNLVTSANLSLTVLYDKIECQLRSLESLGVTTEKCSSMLFPLVESCLPEDILRVWQRSNSSAERNSKDKLDSLMNFVRLEVENEEKISMAVAGIGPSKSGSIKKRVTPPNMRQVHTAAGLLTTNNKIEKKLYNDKKRLLFQKKCCFICLLPGHTIKKCKVRGVKCNKCERRHYEVMCRQGEGESTVLPDSSLVSESNDTSVVARENSLASFSDAQHDVVLQTMCVILKGDNNIERRARSLLDTGSQRSYILKKTAEELGYKSLGNEKVIHSLFGGLEVGESLHSLYKLHMKSIDRDYSCNFLVLDQQVICGNIKISGNIISRLKKELNDFNIILSDQISGEIEILIGADVADRLFAGKVVQLSSGLTVVDTFLSRTILGKSHVERNVCTSNTLLVTALLINDMKVADLWELDRLGINDPFEHKSRQQKEMEALDFFEKTVTIGADNRYIVSLPWVKGNFDLPSNYDLALRRLEVTTKRLQEDKCYREYGKTFQDWLENGIIERVKSEVSGHYLPHRHVLKPNSTTKIRPVFDVSAHSGSSLSLNKCLEKGINLIEKIPSILCRFRLNILGVIADIRKAFLQIGLVESDRDVLRFLWKNEKGEIEVFRHYRVAFGVTCSPFLLGAVIQYHLKKILNNCIQNQSDYSKDVIELLMNSFYVDNCITSLDNEFELRRFINESKAVMNEAEFDLRGWESNNLNLSETDDSVNEFNVLGLIWDRVNDTLYIRSDNFANLGLNEVTKRLVLSISHRIYEPIGFSVVVTLFPKLLLRRLCEDKLGWDDELSIDIRHEFLNWEKNLYCLSDIKIPRCFVPVERSGWVDVSLHTFCDASQFAYAAASFLRVETINGVCTQLVQARSRVAPVKPRP